MCVFKFEYVDNEIKLLNIVVVVAFKLLIDNIVFGPMTDPPTFSVDNMVTLFEVNLYEVISYIPDIFHKNDLSSVSSAWMISSL